MGSTNVNLTDSLPVMEGRKSLRRFRGAYQKTRPVLAWFMFILLLTIWTFASSSFDGITVTFPSPHHPSPFPLSLPLLPSSIPTITHTPSFSHRCHSDNGDEKVTCLTDDFVIPIRCLLHLPYGSGLRPKAR
jgi:hypothetical protein